MSDQPCSSTSQPNVTPTVPVNEQQANPAEQTEAVEVKKKMVIKLEAEDGAVIQVEQDVAFKSYLIKGMLADLQITDADDKRLEDPLPVANVNGETLAKVMEYCEKYRDVPHRPRASPQEDPRFVLNEWEKSYLECPLLMEIIMAANYLDIPGLVDISTQFVANMAEGKTVEQLRTMFMLGEDGGFTPEEQREIDERFAWVEA